MKTVIISAIVAVLVIVVGVGAFFAGSAYGEAQAQNTRAEFLRTRQGGTGAPSGAPGQFGQPGQSGQGNQGTQGGQQFGRPIASGTVKSVSGNIVQVTLQDGSVATFNVDAQTVIQKTVNGTIGDIQAGERITALGDQSGNTSTARTIQIRPAGGQPQ